jgi:hypothetical protein
MKKIKKPAPRHKPAPPKARKPPTPIRRSKAMNGEQEQRGAGSGEKATTYRSQMTEPEEEKPRTEVVDALEKEAEAQADYNAEMHDLQVQQTKAFHKSQIERQKQMIEDADKTREENKKQFEELNDPKKKESMLKAQQKLREEKFGQTKKGK